MTKFVTAGMTKFETAVCDIIVRNSGNDKAVGDCRLKLVPEGFRLLECSKFYVLCSKKGMEPL